MSVTPAVEGIHLNLFKSFHSLERDVVNILAHASAVAALNAAHTRGRNQRFLANQLAVNAMRQVLDDELPIPSEIVIGEGDGEESPLLQVGERLGPEGEVQMAIAVDPLEGTNLCARGEPGAITVIAAAMKGEGELMGNIRGYFDKVIVGKDLAQRLCEMRCGNAPATHVKVTPEHGLIDNSIEDIVRWVAYERQKTLREVVVMVLERERNEDVIEELRQLNAQVLLIGDGDITAGLLALDADRDVDITLGIGAAPEGVITAAICKVFQGYMETRWWLDDPKHGAEHRQHLVDNGIDEHRLYTLEDLAAGHVMFALTGVTYNQYTPGVQYLTGGAAVTHTIYGRSRSGTVYERRAIHQNPPAPPSNLSL